MSAPAGGTERGEPPAAERTWRRLAWPAAVLILLLHGALALSSLTVKSITNDESTHLAAGLAAVETGEIQLNHEHPPLVKLLAGLSASTAAPSLPVDRSDYAQAKQFEFAKAVVFGEGNDTRTLTFRGRLPIVLVSMLGGLGVFLWSRQRFGAGGGLLSLALFAFSPTVLAHGRLVTMDATVAVGSVWTLYLWWRLTRPAEADRRFSKRRAILCGLALGLTLGAKFSGLILLPAMALVQSLATPLTPRLAAARRRRSDAPASPSGTVSRAVVLEERLLPMARPWLWMLPTAVVVIELLYLLPTDPLLYLHDLRTIYTTNDSTWVYYLHGAFRQGRFPDYFSVALAVKTSLVGLVAMAGGLLTAGIAGGRHDPRWRDDLYLWLPALLWFGVHSALALDLGVRYLLPVYPLLFVLAGGIVPSLRRLPLRAGAPALALLLIVSQAATALAAYPDYLPFFNLLAGGKEGGIDWLDDSNLDWGQDLERLPAWLESHGVEQPHLLYYGFSIPEAYDVDYQPMTRSDWFEAPRPGAYVISAHYLLLGLYEADRSGIATDWLRRYEPVDILGGTLYLYQIRPQDTPRAEEADGTPSPGGLRQSERLPPEWRGPGMS